MKRKWFIIAALLPLFSFSQESSSRSSLHTIASFGVVTGESAAKPFGEIVSGFVYKKWFAGIGAGLDFYRYKSIPLFADYRLFLGKNGSVLAYVDAGYNFPFGNKDETDDFLNPVDHFYGGLYFDAGVGYRIRLNSRHRVLFSAGYSRKDIVHNVEYVFPGTDPPTGGQEYNYRYRFGRLLFKLSWEFGG